MKKDQEGEKKKLNKPDGPRMNRGFELMLRQTNRREESPKKFHVTFGKIMSLLKREISIYFEFSFDIKKQ